MIFKVSTIALCILSFCASALAQDASRSCTLKKLSFYANRLLPVPPSGTSAIWGGSATAGDETSLKRNKFFTDKWKRAQVRASQNGLETFLYTEGKCGRTGGVNNGEIAKCKNKWASWDHANPNRPSKTGPLWQQYTLAQLAAAKKHNVTYCEADNVEDGANLLPFLKAFEKAFRKGDITCQLVLKNVRKRVLEYLASDEGKGNFTDFSFLAPFAIFEHDVGSTVGLDMALRNLTGNPHAITIISSDTHRYGKAFKPKQVVTCGDSTHTPPDDSPNEPSSGKPASSAGALR